MSKSDMVSKFFKEQTGKTAKTVSQIGLSLWQVETEDGETYMVTY